MTVRAPFPWFGGKRRVADVVWRAFGPDIPNYVEPFAGSLAVLLGRPGGPGKIQTCNDADRYLANFFRALTADPDGVARWADWPVNEADLHARHLWLVNQAEFRETMHTDPDFFDVKIAGWWVWGLCQWIGGGWCSVRDAENHKHPKLDGIGKGIHSDAGHRKRPELDGTSQGRGVHSMAGWNARPDLTRRPDLTNAHGFHAAGIPMQRPHLSSENGVHAYSPGRRPAMTHAGQGVHAPPSEKLPNMVPGGAMGTSHLPALGNDRGLNGVAAPPCLEWFRALKERLRRVRVACGDWTRVLGPSVLGKGKNVGGRRPCAVFLDPPYSHEFRDPYLYSQDDASVADKVRAWALEHGDDPELRIALCGYEGEHEMPSTWTVHAWKGARGYAGEDNENRKRERIWFSPHCLAIDVQGDLFAAGVGGSR